MPRSASTHSRFRFVPAEIHSGASPQLYPQSSEAVFIREADCLRSRLRRLCRGSLTPSVSNYRAIGADGVRIPDSIRASRPSSITRSQSAPASGLPS